MTAKEAAIELIRTLPDDVSVDGILEAIHSHVSGLQSTDWETSTFDEVLNTRLQDHLTGADPGVSVETLFQQLRERRTSRV